MTGYSVSVSFASKELTARERIAIKDTTNASSLDELTKDNTNVRIVPDYYAVLDIHNEKSEDKDYKKYVIVDDVGNKYVTGSESFMNAFLEIFDEMQGEDEEYSVVVYRMPSKNYKGKEFLTCSIT